MSPPTPAAETANLEPAPISKGGTYTVENVSVGCKLFIQRPGPDGTTEERRAEILSVRDKPTNPYAYKKTKETAPTKAEDKLEFFVHWDLFNKRLDGWVAGSRLVLTRDMEWPRPKPPPTPNTKKERLTPTKATPRDKTSNNLLKRATSNLHHERSTGAPGSSVPGTPAPEYSAPPSPTANPLKRKFLDELELDPSQDGDDTDTDMDVDEQEGEGTVTFDLTDPPSVQAPKTQVFSKEQEIEKLRTSGSMTQAVSEVARVKNLNKIQMGKHEVEAWYFSPYPKEYAHLPILYICEFCLSFFPSPFMLGRHRKRCTLLHPPGNEIYRHDDISFFEIDGKRQLTYCRNLSLLSKCFLDHKTLYYDVTPFMYYVMTQRDSSGCHILGYFSKEKESAEGYNLACILTLPQHQRYGYGKLLIEFSYELSKKEGKLGSPEKPLSDLGLLGYRAYWSETIIEMLKHATSEGDVSIDEIAQKTSITHADIMNTCTTLQMFKHFKGQNMIVLPESLLQRHEVAMKKRKRRINPDALRWKPPVFTRDQLRFGW